MLLPNIGVYTALIRYPSQIRMASNYNEWSIVLQQTWPTSLKSNSSLCWLICVIDMQSRRN